MACSQRRTVIVSGLVPWARKNGGQLRLWAFGYADLAALLGMKEGTVRQAVAEGRLDPGDLVQLVAFAVGCGRRRVP